MQLFFAILLLVCKANSFNIDRDVNLSGYTPWEYPLAFQAANPDSKTDHFDNNQEHFDKFDGYDSETDDIDKSGLFSNIYDPFHFGKPAEIPIVVDVEEKQAPNSQSWFEIIKDLYFAIFSTQNQEPSSFKTSRSGAEHTEVDASPTRRFLFGLTQKFFGRRSNDYQQSYDDRMRARIDYERELLQADMDRLAS